MSNRLTGMRSYNQGFWTFNKTVLQLPKSEYLLLFAGFEIKRSPDNGGDLLLKTYEALDTVFASEVSHKHLFTGCS